MDFDLRLLLVITGVGLIGYLAWDGWRSRSRDQYKFKLEKNILPEPEQPPAPVREGFDRDGISRPRVKGNYEESGDWQNDGIQIKDFNTEQSSNAFQQSAVPASEHIEPIFSDEAVGQAHTRRMTNAPKIDPQLPLGNTGELFSDEFGTGSVKVKTKAKPSASSTKSEAPTIAEPSEQAPNEIQVISLTVHAPEGKMFNGGDLSVALLEASLVFGEMDIFHRHLDGTAHGEIQFSVANAVKPGTFDPNNLESFVTPGISLFMQMPGPNNPRYAYELMVGAAEQIARTLHGTILDGTRQIFSVESRRAHDLQLKNYEKQRQTRRA